MNCPYCDTEDAYAYRKRPRMICRNPSCRRQFSSMPAHRRWSQMAPERWAEIERLHAEGVNARQISLRTGIEYKTCWFAKKRLEALSA